MDSKATEDNTDLFPEFDAILNKKEEILWAGKPVFTPYFFSGQSVGIGSLYILILLLSIYFFWVPFLTTQELPTSKYIWGAGLVLAILEFMIMRQKVLYYRSLVYAYSAKRLIIKSGRKKTTFTAIDLEKLTEINLLRPGLMPFYKVGSLRFDSGKTELKISSKEEVEIPLYDSWEAMKMPLELVEKIRKLKQQLNNDDSDLKLIIGKE